MGRSSYPFRDPNRRDDAAGARRDDLGNRRDDLGNRRDDVGNRREDGSSPRRDEATVPRREPRDLRPERRPRPEGSPPPSAGLGGLTGDVEELLRLLAGSDVTELQLERGDLKIIIRRGPVSSPSTPHAAVTAVQPLALGGGLHLTPETLVAGDVRGGAPALAPAPDRPASAAAPSGTPMLGEGEHLLTAPMVGTFYASPSPSEPPFVNEGDLVEAGQTIGIIEAMKIMNPIEAEVAGHVRRILARDGQGVEYGQPLLVIAEG